MNVSSHRMLVTSRVGAGVNRKAGAACAAPAEFAILFLKQVGMRPRVNQSKNQHVVTLKIY